MKKTMVMFAAVAMMTASASALSCSWGVYESFVGPGGGTLTAGTAYLFLLDTGTPVNPTYSGGWNLNGATQLASNGTYDSGNNPAWGTSAFQSMGANDAAVLSDGRQYTIVFTTQTGVANLVDVNSGSFFVATAMVGTSETIDLVPTYGVGVNYWTAGDMGFAGVGSWSAVPEPTSMALLALGVAAVGLRRKFRK